MDHFTGELPLDDPEPVLGEPALEELPLLEGFGKSLPTFDGFVTSLPRPGGFTSLEPGRGRSPCDEAPPPLPVPLTSVEEPRGCVELLVPELTPAAPLVCPWESPGDEESVPLRLCACFAFFRFDFLLDLLDRDAPSSFPEPSIEPRPEASPDPVLALASPPRELGAPEPGPADSPAPWANAGPPSSVSEAARTMPSLSLSMFQSPDG